MTRRVFGLAVALSAMAALLAACSSAGLLNAVTSKSGYSVDRDIRYGPGDRGTYDLYVPANATASSPVVVFIFGGSWDSGSKDIYLFLGQSLASQGIIVAVPNYRLYPQVIFPGFVEDGAKAVAAIASTAEAGRHGMPGGHHPLFVMGHSAGAQIAALIALDKHYLRDAGLSTTRLSGFIGLAGPYDFLPLKEERYKRIFPPALRAASQPVNFAQAPMPPMLLIAGTADTTVEPRNSVSLGNAVRKAGGSAEVVLVPGVDHIGAISALATALPFNDGPIRARVLDFIRQHS